jgi:hypothetical protein
MRKSIEGLEGRNRIWVEYTKKQDGKIPKDQKSRRETLKKNISIWFKSSLISRNGGCSIR